MSKLDELKGLVARDAVKFGKFILSSEKNRIFTWT